MSEMSDIDVFPRSSLLHRIIQIITDLIVIIIILVILALVYFLVDPTIGFFTCNDTDIFFPYKPSTIPFWIVGVYGIVGPLLFILFIELLNSRVLPFQSKERTVKQCCKTFFVCFFHGTSLFFLGLSLTVCLTELGKRWVKYHLKFFIFKFLEIHMKKVMIESRNFFSIINKLIVIFLINKKFGRLRPYFIEICNPDWNLVRCTNMSLGGSYFNYIYTGGNFCRGNKIKLLR